MSNRRIPSMPLALFLLLAAAALTAQDEHEGVPMGHSKTTLFVAALRSENVVRATDSDATGTGAFVLAVDGAWASLRYDITFDAVDSAGGRTITLRNSGEGGEGEVVHEICGAPDSGCPAGAGATVTGEWTSGGTPPLSPEMVREIAADRIYLEIASGEDAVSLRAQLTTSRLMVPARGHVARMEPLERSEEGGGASGTGAFFVTYFPDGTQKLDYQMTVTGLSSPVAEAKLVSGAGEGTERSLEGAATVMNLAVDSRAQGRNGGTISGGMERGAVDTGRMAEQVIDLGRGGVTLVVTTRDNAAGELFATVEPLE